MRGMFGPCLTGLFEMRAAEYLDSYPEPETSGVNRFLKGLGKSFAFSICLEYFHVFSLFYSQICLFAGSKMKFLQKK